MTRFCVTLLLLVLGCATGPAPPAPGKSTAFGSLRLVPREGVTPTSAETTPYSDRALRDVEYVDYAHPGFAVVYLEGRSATGGTAELAIRASSLRTRIEPAAQAVGAGGTLRVRNQTAAAHVLAFPAASLVKRLAPGEELQVPVSAPGRQSLFLLDVPDSEATVFVAPGPYTVVGDDGSFELRDVEPGRLRLIAWHPRFPPAFRWVDLAPGGVVRADIELGVGHLAEMPDETH